jgi:hypothetical protein
MATLAMARDPDSHGSGWGSTPAGVPLPPTRQITTASKTAGETRSWSQAQRPAGHKLASGTRIGPRSDLSRGGGNAGSAVIAEQGYEPERSKSSNGRTGRRRDAAPTDLGPGGIVA